MRRCFGYLIVFASLLEAATADKETCDTHHHALHTHAVDPRDHPRGKVHGGGHGAHEYCSWYDKPYFNKEPALMQHGINYITYGWMARRARLAFLGHTKKANTK